MKHKEMATKKKCKKDLQEKKGDNHITLSSDSFLLGALQWFVLAAGAFAWVVPWIFPIIEDPWKSLVMNIGSVCITGVLLGFISSHRHLKHFYKNDLNEVLFGEKFLEKRKDIEDIWKKTTRSLFKSKFPNINDSLFELIKSTYLSPDNVIYYDDYRVNLNIAWALEGKNYIVLKDDIEYTLITDSNGRRSFPQSNTINVDPTKTGHSSKMTIFVDGESKEICEGQVSGTELVIKCNIEVEGKQEYHIRRLVKKRYCIEDDNFIGYRSKYITNNLTVTIQHPENLILTLVERGTEKDFKSRKFDDKSCEYRYKGLILPRQGFIIILSQKPSV